MSRPLQRIVFALTAALTLLPFQGAAEGPAQHAVSQRDKAFTPAELRVRAGDSVLFKNDDTVAHNMFSRDANAEFNLKMQQPGETKEPVLFSKPGTFTVRCAIHPSMKLIVNVE